MRHSAEMNSWGLKKNIGHFSDGIFTGKIAIDCPEVFVAVDYPLAPCIMSHVFEI